MKRVKLSAGASSGETVTWADAMPGTASTAAAAPAVTDALFIGGMPLGWGW